MFILSNEDYGFDLWSGQSKEYKSDIGLFHTKDAVSRNI
jgi:hypothetical protein